MMEQDDLLKRILDKARSVSPQLVISGVSGAAGSYLLSRIVPDMDRTCLVLTPSAKEAVRLYRELEFFLPPGLARGSHRERRLYDFPAYDISPLSGLSPQKELVSRRIQALYALTHLPGSVVVSSVEAAAVRIMPKKALAQGLDYLEAGEEIDREALLRRLFEIGYTRTSLVEERGDFAVRGGVVDVFPPLYSEPARIELWGDQIESIRHFDALSQRSTEDLGELVLLPASEILLREENVRRARSLGRLPGGTREGGGFPGQEAWLSHYYPELSSLLDYLPDQGLLVRIEPASIKQGLERFKERFFRDVERYRQDAEEREQPFPEVQGLLMDEIHPPAEDGGGRFIDFMELSVETHGPGVETVHIQGATGIQDSLELRVEGKGTISMAPLAESAERWIEQGSRVVLVSRTDQQARRLREILANYGMEAEETAGAWSEVASGRGLSLCLGRLSRGFAWPAMGLHVVSEDEIFGPKQVRPGRKRRPGLEGLTWTSFSRLQIGDPVVHEDHGIGLYGGLVKMEVEDRANDFVVVDYEGGDRLYVPADRISILQKYVGAEDKAPKLDRLGGRSWDIAKKKAKKSVKEIARQLVEIYALRSYKQGHAFGPPDNRFREFEAGFEHEETADQVKAIEDVLDDMQSERPMDRLVCGDVGFGKTEVAVRAAFKAVSEGKQVAVLVPTTVLAEQHFETFRSRMEPYGVRVGVLSRFKSRSEQKDVVARVRSGKIDVIIGTHRLLQKDVGFMDLGLLVVDEEQRFGVKQKEAIKRYRALVDVLALAATPIPRTLHLSLMGVRDLSLIETPPEERKAIQTHILPYDEAAVVHAVERELERGGQVFFVHNRVQTIKSTAARLQELLPSARVAVAHGQMKEQDLEETMIRFVRREIDLLVCTTIIESGLDIPSANTIIIHEAERFGLAQIYQLRGRVGRSNETAYAYLLLSDTGSMTRESVKRLKALMDFSQLGAGLQLAMHDLKIRGGGNVLGFSQSGHITAVGYELYIKMVEEAVAELKGETWREEINPEIHADISAYLPEQYASDPDVRLNLYRRLSGIKEPETLESLESEIKDRFGPPPREVKNLLELMRVRVLMKRLRITRLDVGRGALVLTFAGDTEVDAGALVSLMGQTPGKYKLLSGEKLRIVPSSPRALECLGEVKRLLERLSPPEPADESRDPRARAGIRM